MKLSETLLNTEDRRENYIMNLLKQSLLIDRILEDCADHFRLPAAAAQAFQTAILNYNLLTTELRLAFGGEQLFNFTFKQHALAHIGEDAKELSPRLA